jgi:Zn finger protein HypA/HybF involved in hydrogenase expression
VSMMVRAWHWCESCESPSWFHNAYYFCKECDLEKYSMENDDYSEGEHENAVPLKIECVEVTA